MMDGWTTIFDLVYRQESSTDTDGRVYVKDLGRPLWRMRTISKMLSPNALDKWRGLLGDYGDSVTTFKAWPTSRCRPIARPNDTGDATTTIVDLIDPFTLELGVDYLQAGDMIEVDNTYLYRITSSTGAVVTVEPPVELSVGAGSTVSLYEPGTTMMVVPGTLSIESGRNGWGTVSLDAIEVYGTYSGEDWAS